MGRKKFMLDGQLRGRNELIQDSIRRDTGITRDRKQVSSHLQVLKQHLHNQPGGESNTSLSMCNVSSHVRCGANRYQQRHAQYLWQYRRLHARSTQLRQGLCQGL
jgi:hypothetical protein